jgi:uncharacterized protein (TIGR02996 family)
MSEHPGLLADVLEHPDEDGPRLVFADWLEDQGDLDRAEFVRVQCELARLEVALAHAQAGDRPVSGGLPLFAQAQALRQRERELLLNSCDAWTAFLPGQFQSCDVSGAAVCKRLSDEIHRRLIHYHFRRGFVEEVTCTLRDWCGGPCGRCEGRGWTRSYSLPPEQDECFQCDSSGLVVGHGPAIVRAQPVRRVRVSDKTPRASQAIPGAFYWRAEDPPEASPPSLDTYIVPAALRRFLGGRLADQKSNGCRYYYDSEADALDDLSDACLLFARQVVY